MGGGNNRGAFDLGDSFFFCLDKVAGDRFHGVELMSSSDQNNLACEFERFGVVHYPDILVDSL